MSLIANIPLPVAPYVFGDYAIPSLLELAPRDQIRATYAPPAFTGPDLPSVTTDFRNIQVSMALELGFVGLISMNVDANAQTYLRSTQVITGTVDRSTDTGTIIETEYYGFAMRTAVSIWKASVSVQATFEEVVAAAKLKGSESAMQVQLVGCANPLTTAIAPNLGVPSTGMSPAAMQPIIQMEQAFWAYLKSRPNQIGPVLLGVDLKPGFIHQVWQQAPSANYALQGIKNKYTLAEISPNGTRYVITPQPVDFAVVQAIYADFQITDSGIKPTDDQSRQARAALFDDDN